MACPTASLVGPRTRRPGCGAVRQHGRGLERLRRVHDQRHDRLGTWVLNNTAGIRGFPYDASFPDNFGKLGTGRYTEVHNNGEIWCAALMELNRRIGVALAIEIVVDGMKLTPANPTYLQARDGILAALRNKGHTERWGDNLRRIRAYQAWRAFARFGMGVHAMSGASTGYTGIVADFTVPRITLRSGDQDGDGHAEILVSSPWGVGVLEAGGRDHDRADDGAQRHPLRRLAAQHRRQRFGPVGDFDGDGHAEILVSSPWGIGVLKLPGNTLTAPMMAPNGTRFGGWLLNTADNRLRPGGRLRRRRPRRDPRHQPLGDRVSRSWRARHMTVADDGAQRHALRRLAAQHRRQRLGPGGRSSTATGTPRSSLPAPGASASSKLAGATLAAPMMAPNGTRFGGWLLNTADNRFGPSATSTATARPRSSSPAPGASASSSWRAAR